MILNENKIKRIEREIQYYSKIYNPECKKVKEYKEKLAKVYLNEKNETIEIRETRGLREIIDKQ